MNNLITLWDGRTTLVYNKHDMLYLVDEYMGSEARCWLEEYDQENSNAVEELDDMWKLYSKYKENYKSLIQEIQTESDKLFELLDKKRLNRQEISESVKSIRHILRRENQ